MPDTKHSIDGLQWIDAPTRLDFRFGEFVFCFVRFRSRMLDMHFTELEELANGPSFPFDHFPPDVDLIKFPHPILPESQIPRVSLLPEAIRYVPGQYRHYYIDLSVGFEKYMGKFSSRARYNIRQRVKRFREHSGGEIQWREYREPQEAHDFYALAREVSKKTYQEKLLKRGLPAGDAFLSHLETLAAEDCFRGYILFHQDKPIAYIYGRIDTLHFIYEQIGYDPAHREWAPGTVILNLVLERQFSEARLRIFDFTEGDGPQKELFSNQSRLCANFLFFRRTARNLALVRLHASLVSSSAAVTRSLDRLGVKSRLKKFLRRLGTEE